MSSDPAEISELELKVLADPELMEAITRACADLDEGLAVEDGALRFSPAAAAALAALEME